VSCPFCPSLTAVGYGRYLSFFSEIQRKKILPVWVYLSEPIDLHNKPHSRPQAGLNYVADYPLLVAALGPVSFSEELQAQLDELCCLLDACDVASDSSTVV